MTNTKLILPFAKLYERNGWFSARQDDFLHGQISINRFHPNSRHFLYEKETYENGDFECFIYDRDTATFQSHSIGNQPAQRFRGRYNWYVAGWFTGYANDLNLVPNTHKFYMSEFQKMFPSIDVDGNWKYSKWSRKVERELRNAPEAY